MKTKVYSIGAITLMFAWINMALVFSDVVQTHQLDFEEIETIDTPVISANRQTACAITNTAFMAGEEIVYKIYYNWNFIWLPAGEVVFKTEDAGELFHITATGRTYSSYEWFFKIRDKYEVFVSKETLLPVTAIRNVHEGGYKLYDKLEFDQQNRKITSLRGKTKENAVLRSFDVKDCLHDILSIVYHVRNLKVETLSEGDEVPIKIFMDKEVWPLKVKYEGKEPNKKIKDSGRFNTIKVSPEVIVGDVFTEEAKMNIWVTDDDNKLPLLIESPVSIGSVKVVLKTYNGLRHQMNARTK